MTPPPDTGPGPDTAHGAGFRAAWVEALDRLELDVDEAEVMLASSRPDLPDVLTEWVPPEVRGPLPADLVPRARLVLERQLAVAHLLTQRLAANTQQQRLTRAVRETSTPDVPVYLDVTA